ncbi:MAG: hypothetical protein K8R68_05705 [Bacteroidales bacterium]|nr:hypothetical protein [Bacteroidales bacterium]
MGQQQLLLIVLSVIIVGIAIVVGINMFSSSAAAANQDSVVNDCMDIASRAHQYLIKPGGMGGGGGAFTGVTMAILETSTVLLEYENDNGYYTIGTITATTAQIIGLGKTLGKDGKVCQVTTTITYATGAVTMSTVIVRASAHS